MIFDLRKTIGCGINYTIIFLLFTCRYIVTSPDRTILSRQELDAFLATAFSPHMLNVDYTQELVVSCPVLS